MTSSSIALQGYPAGHLFERINAKIELDDNLLDEVIGLVEWPTLVMGSFDTAGCRMDSNGEFKQEHDTKYGKALDDCSNYSNAKLEKTGTLFYPIN